MGGVGAKKSLGQHFLTDAGIIRSIVHAAPAEPETIVEIGPGEGALLEPLLELGRPVVAVEKDSRLAERWAAAGRPGLTVIEADATDPAWLDRLPQGELGVVGNLPYNASTAILRLLLTGHLRFPWLVLMFQKEVAERLHHGGSRAGGPMGVLAQTAYRIERILDAPPGAFRPPPKVTSQVLRFVRRPDALDAGRIPAAWSVLTRLYARRRAKLDKAVAAVAGVDRATIAAWFDAVGLAPDARPDHMSADAFVGLLDRIESEGERA